MNPIKIGDFIYNAAFTRGMFSALTARDYFANILNLYLLEKLKNNASVSIFSQEYLYTLNVRTLTFKEFFNLTGVDLVLTGTNVTKKRPMYFSATFTPDFPVIEAVQISMNIPFVFKPIWVKHIMDKNNPYKRKKYNGFWVDGGMLNNYPVHAFDNLERNKPMPFQSSNINDNNIKTDMAVEAKSNEILCDCFVGFRLSSGIEKRDALEEANLKLFDNDPLINTLKKI